VCTLYVSVSSSVGSCVISSGASSKRLGWLGLNVSLLDWNRWRSKEVYSFMESAKLFFQRGYCLFFHRVLYHKLVVLEVKSWWFLEGFLVDLLYDYFALFLVGVVNLGVTSNRLSKVTWPDKAYDGMDAICCVEMVLRLQQESKWYISKSISIIIILTKEDAWKP
jgi:hypothetical protein